MIDTHCHLDLYADPYQVASAIEQERILTIAVTNSPTAFERAYPHVQAFRYIRLALGLHPLTAESHLQERDRFMRYFSLTSYIGEVGLDFSREGNPSRKQQLESFRFVLQHLRTDPKFVSVHSRRAETAVLDLLEEAAVTVVFHWFTGSQVQLERLLRQGHYCSVNPAMVQSKRGKALIEQIPRDRLLTETDGPFVSIGRLQAQPRNVAQVELFIASLWMCSIEEVRTQIQVNMSAIVPLDAS